MVQSVLTIMMIEVRGCFDVLIPKGSTIQNDLVAKTLQRCPLTGSCVSNISHLISLKCIKV